MAAVLWVAIAEPNRNRKKHPRPFTVNDVHPFPKKLRAGTATEEKVSMKSLRGMFKSLGVKGA